MYYYGAPVYPTLKNFHAWSPKDLSTIPYWIENVFPNADDKSYNVYTRGPMKHFLVKKDDFIVRCTLGNIVFFLVVNKSMFENWWRVDQDAMNEIQKKDYHAELYQEHVNCLIQDIEFK